MAVLNKTYAYKASRGGVYLGLLPTPSSDFTYNQNIGTAGAQLQIEIPYSADTARESVDTLITESGDDLITESGDTLTTERQPDLVGNSNSQSLIRNGNKIEVYEYSDYYPNGLLVFTGFISKWQVSLAGSKVIATVVSYGIELDNYLVAGAPTNEISQTSTDIVDSISALDPADFAAFAADPFGPSVGQTFKPTSNQPWLGVILKMQNRNASDIGNVQIRAYDAVGGTLLGTATGVITSVTLQEYTFTFTAPIAVVLGNTYFFTIGLTSKSIVVPDQPVCNYSYATTDVYANGQGYTCFYGSGTPTWSAGLRSAAAGADLYFKTVVAASATSVPYNSYDPAVMIEGILDNYRSSGGQISYSAATIDLTSVVASYTFQVNTVLEGVKKAAELGPGNWYWYVDPATGLLYYKQTLTTATHVMIKGRHIEDLEIVASIEDIVNKVYFTGGEVSAGVNLYTLAQDSGSITDFGVRLNRTADNRVILSATAAAITQNILNQKADEQYQTTIEISDAAYNTRTMDLGETVGFAGMGNFGDSLILQIVGKTPTPYGVRLQLGVLPKRTTEAIEGLLRELLDQQTINNPSTPS